MMGPLSLIPPGQKLLPTAITHRLAKPSVGGILYRRIRVLLRLAEKPASTILPAVPVPTLLLKWPICIGLLLIMALIPRS